MAISRWEPFHAMERIHEEIDRLMEEFFERPWLPRVAERVRLLPIDMYETPDAIIVKATVAGVRPEDIEINVTGNTLTIRGERKEEAELREGQAIRRERWYGTFRRDITLPAPVQADRAEATFEHGELTLRLPKAVEARPKRIEVKTTRA